MRKSILLIILMSCFSLISQALTPTDAKRLYDQKDYVGAAAAYDQLLKDSSLTAAQQAPLYYNYASCQYRLHNYALSIWGYQSALRINPSDADAAFNLQLTQSKLQDQFDEPSEIFFFSWTRALIRHFSATTWGYRSAFPHAGLCSRIQAFVKHSRAQAVLRLQHCPVHRQHMLLHLCLHGGEPFLC